MRLGGITEIPKRAGDAEIVFEEDEYGRLPTRNGDIIRLPNGEDNQFFPLMDTRQFLFRNVEGEKKQRFDAETPQTPLASFLLGSRRFGRQDGTQVYFGGTDEKPFLTELTRVAYQALIDEGEEFFYQSLVPSRVAHLGHLWGALPKRQGDIWALPLPCDVWELNGPTLDLADLPVTFVVTDSEHTSLQLCLSRHQLVKGLVWRIRVTENRISIEQGVNSLAAARPSIENIVVCQGLIQAPDHTDLVLQEPHLIEQTANLRNPLHFQAED